MDFHKNWFWSDNRFISTREFLEFFSKVHYISLDPIIGSDLFYQSIWIVFSDWLKGSITVCNTWAKNELEESSDGWSKREDNRWLQSSRIYDRFANVIVRLALTLAVV